MTTHTLIQPLSNPNGDYEVIPGIDEIITRDLVSSFKDVANKAGTSTGTLLKIRTGGKSTVQNFESVWRTLNQMYQEKNREHLSESEKMAAEVIVPGFNALRQKSVYKSRKDFAKALGTREAVVEWIEKGRPISRSMADKVVKVLEGN